MVCGEEIYDFTYCMKCGESAPVSKGMEKPKCTLGKGPECEKCPKNKENV